MARRYTIYGVPLGECGRRSMYARDLGSFELRRRG